jgi:uncharacterized Ntn-hydrolase superfamily protein
MTFSIVARCSRTSQLGVAVSTAVPAVGAMCPFVRAGVGALSTQSWVNPYLALQALDMMAAGTPGPQALEDVLMRDDARHLRQIGAVDASGRASAWSGEGCTGWFGHVVGDGFAVQGNMLAGEATVTAMVRAFRASERRDLAERLLLAIEAGQAAGGDKRGRQSASLKVHSTEDYPLVDLRVDEHARPVAELRRIYTIAKLQLLPFVEGMPKKGGPGTPAPEAVVKLLALPPPQRPGGGGSAF